MLVHEHGVIVSYSSSRLVTGSAVLLAPMTMSEGITLSPSVGTAAPFIYGAIMENLQPLLDRLSAAHFSGTMELRFESGSIASAELTHFIGKDQFGADIPILQGGDCQHGQCACHERERQRDLF
jgi:hypothetical protein